MMNAGHRPAFVIPYVNGDDPVWRRAFYAVGGDYDNSMLHGAPRYKDAGTCELLLESIDKFAPWADVYMVVAMPSQIPAYARGRKKYKFIFHSDFLPENIRPFVFQSNAIETFIGRMPLPEHFIWMNDDIIFLKQMVEGDFFRDGIPCHTFYLENAAEHSFWSYGWNVSNFSFLFPEATQKICKTQHGPTPLRMSWCRELYDKYGQKMEKTIGAITERQDGQINQLVYSLYQYWFKQTFSSQLSGECITRKSKISENLLRKLDWVCINENPNFCSLDAIDKVRNFLKGSIDKTTQYKGRLIKRF